MLYDLVVIAAYKCLSQLNYIAHFGDLKQKNRWFEIGDLNGRRALTFLEIAMFWLFTNINMLPCSQVITTILSKPSGPYDDNRIQLQQFLFFLIVND